MSISYASTPAAHVLCLAGAAKAKTKLTKKQQQQAAQQQQQQLAAADGGAAQAAATAASAPAGSLSSAQGLSGSGSLPVGGQDADGATGNGAAEDVAADSTDIVLYQVRWLGLQSCRPT